MRARLRVIHPRINYYLHEAIFRQSFRVDQTVFVQIEQYIGRYLVNNQRNHALSPRQKILTALHFLGNGCQYHVNGQTHTISKSTVFRCIHRICRLIWLHIMPFYIRWPTNCFFIEQEFFDLAGFPHVKGVVDGTIVHIDAPKIGEPLYVGRDNKHPTNVLIVSGPKNEFFFCFRKALEVFMMPEHFKFPIYGRVGKSRDGDQVRSNHGVRHNSFS